MLVKLVLCLTVFCAVIGNINSEKSYDGRPYMQGYYRNKRGKYNSGPQKYYGRPPSPGPPSYLRPPNSRPSKVSNRPTNDGLGEEDINNIVNYLSKSDLDKIIELAGKRDRDSDKYEDSFQKHEYRRPKDDFNNRQSNFYHEATENYPNKAISDDNKTLFKRLWQEIDTDLQPKSLAESKPFVVGYNTNKPIVSYVTLPTPTEDYFEHQNNNLYDIDTAALAAEESMLQKQIEYLKSQINDGVVYTDSKIMPEENLPKPMNLREEQDHEVAYTNNVPTVVKREQSNSYKLENFGNLPIMNYDSKLDSVSSYHVPHYTVTQTPSKPFSPPPYFPPPSLSVPYGVPVPAVEPAPPASAASSQSDAHQKAVRIWSHKSQGTAYTLHDDGSLSLEKPGRPKSTYGLP